MLFSTQQAETLESKARQMCAPRHPPHSGLAESSATLRGDLCDFGAGGVVGRMETGWAPFALIHRGQMDAHGVMAE